MVESVFLLSLLAMDRFWSMKRSKPVGSSRSKYRKLCLVQVSQIHFANLFFTLHHAFLTAYVLKIVKKREMLKKGNGKKEAMLLPRCPLNFGKF